MDVGPSRKRNRPIERRLGAQTSPSVPKLELPSTQVEGSADGSPVHPCRDASWTLMGVIVVAGPCLAHKRSAKAKGRAVDYSPSLATFNRKPPPPDPHSSARVAEVKTGSEFRAIAKNDGPRGDNRDKSDQEWSLVAILDRSALDKLSYIWVFIVTAPSVVRHQSITRCRLAVTGVTLSRGHHQCDGNYEVALPVLPASSCDTGPLEALKSIPSRRFHFLRRTAPRPDDPSIAFTLHAGDPTEAHIVQAGIRHPYLARSTRLAELCGILGSSASRSDHIFARYRRKTSRPSPAVKRAPVLMTTRRRACRGDRCPDCEERLSP